jgi:hypothetical protein
MDLIKESEGVDFAIKSKPLTKEEEQALSAFIREYKEKQKSKTMVKKRTISRNKTKLALL